MVVGEGSVGQRKLCPTSFPRDVQGRRKRKQNDPGICAVVVFVCGYALHEELHAALNSTRMVFATDALSTMTTTGRPMKVMSETKLP